MCANKSVWRITSTQATSLHLSTTRQWEKSLKTVLWLVFGLLNSISLMSCEGEFFYVALHKRPTTWPRDATCGQKSPSQFCERSTSSLTEAICVNQSVCDVSCPSTFYHFAALARPEIVLDLLDESRSSGWSRCVAKNFSVLCPSEFAGRFSVRFQAPVDSTDANCSLMVNESWLAPFVISDTWNITISMWLYSQLQDNSVGTLVEIASSQDPLLKINLESARIKIQSGSLLLEEPSWQIPLDQWNHLAFVIFQDFINIFLNGQVLPPGVFQLRLMQHNTADKCLVGQSIFGESQFIGYMQNVQIYFGAVSNREVQYIYNRLKGEDYLVQPNCTCPSTFPALVPQDSGLCQQNPGNLSPPDAVPRLNPVAHPIDFITDGDLNTFWISPVNSTGETNSISIDFGSVYQVQSVLLCFYSPVPMVTTILRKRSLLSPWEPWQIFSRDCSDLANSTGLAVLCRTIMDQPPLNGCLTFDVLREATGGEDQLQSLTLASAINVSMTGFPVNHPLYRYHALYEVSVNATCYCYGRDSVCNPNRQSCLCGEVTKTSGLNCDTCVAGFYLDPSANDRICHLCNCDERGTINGSGNCHPNGGQCLCKSNVKGHQCDVCSDGFYNLTASNVDGCQTCRCHVNGTVSCDADTGECVCAGNVEGSTCDRCRPETFWSKSGSGCDTCDCFAPGAENRTTDCDMDTGQCRCKRNVGSRSCDHCEPGFYDLQDTSDDGCVPCNCSTLGAVDGAACNDVTGQCICRPAEGDVSRGGEECNSYFIGFYPDFGPESGGTVVNMMVGFIGDVRRLVVNIGSLPCAVDNNSSFATQVVCVTVPLANMSDLLNQSLPLTIQLPTGQMLSTRQSFTYYPDPVIERVWPLRTIESGGINLTVVGSSLRSVALPRLRVMMVQTLKGGREMVTVFTSPCFHVENTLICPTPGLILPKKQTPTRRDVPHPTVSRAVPDLKNDSRDDLRFYIGFVFDGFDKYLNLSKTLPRYGLLDVYENPTICLFTEPDRIKKLRQCQPYNDSSLIIKGYNLDFGAGINDYIINVGHQPCDIVQLTSNQIICMPPYHQPPPENEIYSRNGFPAVKVTVGNILNSPGFLEYDESCDNYRDLVTRYSVGAAAVVAVIIIVIVIVICVLAKRRRPPKPSERLNSSSSSSSEICRPTNLYFRSKKTLRSRSMYLTPISSTLEAFLCRLPDDLRLKVEDCLLEGQDLTLTRMVGQGNFGQVFVGQLTGNDNVPLEVAVKMLRDNQLDSRPQEVIDFLDEATLMHQLNHEHILSLVGIIIKPSSANVGICIVLPYMENGDLRTFISNEANVLNVKALLGFGLQVADGMKYLEANKFIHRDLACRNCMVSGCMVVKVADFGLSRDIYERDYYRASDSRRPLPVKWMAIESLEGGIFSTKSDVWSFGVLLWELLTRGSIPYPDLDHMDVKAHLKSGKRLARPDFAPDEIYSLMMDCWQDILEKRPAFRKIERRIRQFLKLSENPSKTNSNHPLQENESNVLQSNDRSCDIHVEMSESEPSQNSDICHRSSQMDSNVSESNDAYSTTCEQLNCNELDRLESLCNTNSETALNCSPADISNMANCNVLLKENEQHLDDDDDDATSDYTRL